jgi:hypothetical protein
MNNTTEAKVKAGFKQTEVRRTLEDLEAKVATHLEKMGLVWS